MTPDRRHALKGKVSYWLKEGIIRRVKYPEWVANAKLIKLPDGTWQCFLWLPEDNSQIRMVEDDEEKIGFHIEEGRHPNAAIDDPRPSASSFNMADVRRLSAHVIKVPMEMWTGAEVYEEPHLDVRPPFKSFPFITLLLLRPRSALAQSSGSTTCPSLFVGDDDESDDDDDACVEIPLVTPLRYTVVIPSLGNQGGNFIAPTAEGSNTRDSRGKGVMVDDAAAPSSGVSLPRPSSRPAPSFKDVSDDAIHTDLFPFSAGPYYATYPEGGVARNCEFTCEELDDPYWPTFGVLTKEVFKDPAVCKAVMDQFPTPGEMVRVESLSDDQLTAKMSVLHCMMISHGSELLACYRGLNQSHHEYVLSAESKLKGYEEKVANMTGLEFQVAALKKQVSGFNDKLTSSDASFSKSMLRWPAFPLL
ncbi:hypothetical protein Tco_0127742 [Tanacetum coccineum]